MIGDSLQQTFEKLFERAKEHGHVNEEGQLKKVFFFKVFEPQIKAGNDSKAQQLK